MGKRCALAALALVVALGSAPVGMAEEADGGAAASISSASEAGASSAGLNSALAESLGSELSPSSDPDASNESQEDTDQPADDPDADGNGDTGDTGGTGDLGNSGNSGSGSGDEQPATVSQLDLYYRYLDEGFADDQKAVLFDASDETTWPEIWEGRTLRLSATVTLSNGEIKYIPEESDLWDWVVTASYDASGNSTSQLVTVTDERNITVSETAPNGAAGKSTVTFTLQQFPDYVHSSPLTVKVSERPADKVYAKSVSLTYTDSRHTSPASYDASNLPSINSATGSVRFYAAVNYSDGSSAAGAEGSWSVTSVTDWSGNAISSVSASIDANGNVYASGSGNALVNISFALSGNDSLTASA